MLEEIGSGAKREVDIVIETVVARQPIMIGIECVDKNRRATVEWVEQMHGKHSRLPTNQLVLASRRGFARPALDKAKEFNIQTLAFAEATERKVGSLFSAITELITTEYALTHGTTSVRAIAPDGQVLDSDVEEATIIFNKEGAPINTFKGAVNVLFSPQSQSRIVANAPENQNFYFKIVGNYDDKDYYVLNRSSGQLNKVETISVIGKLDQTASRFPMEQIQVGSDSVLWGKSQLFGSDAIAVLSDEEGNGRLSISVTPLLKENPDQG